MNKIKQLMLSSLLMISFIGFAQDRTITGTVSDDDSLALPGATVVVEGTNVGVTTDFDGNYEIQASEGDVLVFSYVGFDNLSIEVGKSNVINVTLSSSNKLDEVVVTGITSRSRKRLTSSTVTVSGEQIEGVAMTAPDQALQGRVAGLRVVTTSGTPGAPTSIRIRGEGSLTGSNSPLFVIDGVPVDNGVSNGSLTNDIGLLSLLNPSDIESITVLKDASATAPYGSRGSNGVIVITTKSGSAGEVKYEVSSNYGFQNYALDERPMLTGEQRLELGAETIMNTYGWDKDRATNYVISRFPGVAAWDAGGRVDGDWENAVKVKDAPYQRYNLSASGGNSSENFRASVGYNNTVGTSIGVNFEQINGSFTYRRIAGNVTIETSNRVSNAIQDGQLEGGSYFAAPQMTRVFMAPVHQPKNPDGTWNTNLATSIFNTGYLAENNISRNDATRAISNTGVKIKLADGLRFQTRYAIDYNLGNAHRYQNPTHGGGVTENGYAYQSTSRSFSWNTLNTLSYDKSFGDHNVSATAQFSFGKSKYDFLSSSGENVAADGLVYVTSFGTNRDGTGSFVDTKRLGYVGLLNYSFQDKYIADFSFRRDGSSRFAPGYRMGNFWSGAVAWNITNESFLADNPIINTLRLRASIGETGSNSVGINAYQSLFGYGGSYNDNGAVSPSSYGNGILTWEKQSQMDVGLEYSILGDRVSGTIGYFNRKTSDLLQSVPLSRTTGHSSQTKNVGEVENKGLELELSADVISTDNLTWTIYSNYATLDNKVTKLAKDASGNDINLDGAYNRIRVGEELNGWYLRMWAGVNSQTGVPLYNLGEKADGTIDMATTENYNTALKSPVGNRLPTYSGGLGTRLNWKGLFIDANLYFSGGNKIFERWNWYSQQTGLFSTYYYQGAQVLMNRWQKPGDVTNVPKMQYSTSTSSTGSGSSTRFLYDGDYVRLRDLVIGYNLPRTAAEKIGFEDVQLNVRGLNLLTWVKDDDLQTDPEVRFGGQWEIYTPIIKSVSVGLNLKF